MNRFWKRYIQPLIENVQPKRILEIGADRGWNTQHILAYCRQSGAIADIVDPCPQPSLHDVLASYGPAEYRYYALKSIAAISQLATPDIALIDGDHNWATVYAELDQLQATSERHGEIFPIALFHDVAWPYARRDMYYNPDDLNASERHPYAYRGMLPGISELVEEGMNGVLANALHEGGPRNGVLTAIEDFIASSSTKFIFRTLPFSNGLGILVPTARMTPTLQALIDSFYSAEGLMQACIALETESMHIRAQLAQTETQLTRRTEALQRARALLHAQAIRLHELEQAAIPLANVVNLPSRPSTGTRAESLTLDNNEELKPQVMGSA